MPFSSDRRRESGRDPITLTGPSWKTANGIRMLDVLLTLVGMASLGTEEPHVPPPPPLPVLVGAEATVADLSTGVCQDVGDEARAALKQWLRDWAANLPFRSGILFTGGLTPAEIATESGPRDPKALRELAAWSARTNRSNRLRFRFKRMVYDELAGVEKRAEGTVTIKGDTARIEMVPTEVRPGETNLNRRTKADVPFQVVADESALILFDGKSATCQKGEILQSSVHIPPQWQGSSPFSFVPVPFLRLLEPFQEFQSKERSQSFGIELGGMNKPGDQVHLVMKGRSRHWAHEFSRVEVLLRVKTYEPIAVRWFDPAETQETVYIYSDIRRD